MNYLKTAGFKVAVIIGNDLTSTSQFIKKQTGLSIFLKFGKGTSSTGRFEHVENLDTFPIPKIDLLLTFEKIEYNKLTKQIEISLKNEKEAKIYLRPTIGILSNDKLIETISGNFESIDKKERKGFVFDVDLNNLEEKSTFADIFIPYGSSETELEYAITAKVPINFIEIADPCELDIIELKFIKSIQRFIITVESNRECFADPSLIDLIIEDEKTTIEMLGEEKIKGKAKLKIKQRMTEVDIADNPKIKVKVNFGSRKNMLVKSTEKVLPLSVFENEESEQKSGAEEKMLTILITSLIVLTLIVLILIYSILWQRKKRKNT